MEERVIEVCNLRKSYKSLVAVNDISFIVKKGELFSFLGTNGAGKSTTIDILCTLLKPDSGEIKISNHILGKEDNEIKKDIGIVFQDSVLDPILTVGENLKVRARFYEKDSNKIKVSIRKAEKSDYMVVLEKEKIIERGTPLELKDRYASVYLKIETTHPKKLEEILQSYNKPINEKNSVYQITVNSPKEVIAILDLSRKTK